MRDDSTVALNRRARHEFTIDDTFEAGLVLTGTEIKSIRAGKVNIANAYARIERGEAWLIGADIAPFEQGRVAARPRSSWAWLAASSSTTSAGTSPTATRSEMSPVSSPTSSAVAEGGPERAGRRVPYGPGANIPVGGTMRPHPARLAWTATYGRTRA